MDSIKLIRLKNELEILSNIRSDEKECLERIEEIINILIKEEIPNEKKGEDDNG